MNYSQNIPFNRKKVIDEHYNPFVQGCKQSYFYVGTEFDEVNFQWKWRTGQERF